MEDKRHVLILNMTGFFNRELFMYALGDIRFKTPISLKKAAYVMGFLLIWTLPIILIMGLQFTPLFLAFAIAPPVVLGNFAGKPVWGGKPLFDFLKSLFTFIKEPKGWTDLKNNNMKEDVYFVENEIYASRRRELNILADIEESRNPTPTENNTKTKKRRKRGRK